MIEKVFTILTISIVLICLLFPLFPINAEGNLHNVPMDYQAIHTAIDSASDGDTVLVQPGTYIENINFSGKNIVVGSLFLTTGDTSFISQTIIDANELGTVVFFTNYEDSTAMMCGFTVTNGFSFMGAYEYTDKPTKIINEKGSLETADNYHLCQNYPNPFNPITKIQYRLKTTGRVTLSIYNILGQLIMILVQKIQPADVYTVRWDGKNNIGIMVPSGIYLYRLQAGNFVQTRKMVLLR